MAKEMLPLPEELETIDVGQRVEIANLLEAHHQLKNVLHRNRRAQFVQMHHTLFLGEVIGLALGRRQVQHGVADDLGRHVLGDFFLDATNDTIARQLRQ